MLNQNIVRVEVVVQNNQLSALIKECGSVSAFCKKIGVTRQAVDKLLGLQCSPFDKRGGYRQIVQKIAEYAKKEPAEIFPNWIYERVQNPKHATSVSIDQVKQVQQSVARLTDTASIDVDFEIKPECLKLIILN